MITTSNFVHLDFSEILEAAGVVWVKDSDSK